MSECHCIHCQGKRREYEVVFTVTAFVDHPDYEQQIADEIASVQYVAVVKRETTKEVEG